LYEAATQELVAAGFRPEFLGRIDERITFLPFSEATCRQLVDRLLHKELTKIREVMCVEVVVPDDARDILAQFTFDRSMEEGARGASRAINQFIVNPVIDLLSDVQRGDQLPASLRAVLLGTSDIQGVRIEWEVTP
jgi:ATP-dependent Clp protease ATP-binding subunit ClpA